MSIEEAEKLAFYTSETMCKWFYSDIPDWGLLLYIHNSWETHLEVYSWKNRRGNIQRIDLRLFPILWRAHENSTRI